ncbi:MAG: DUF1016 N-terminal domain-containing protein, partial [bacterium]|nr:DUF1016 N-terminal domain-containing protein [bacterium]
DQIFDLGESVMPEHLTQTTYTHLKTQIARTLSEGKERARRAVEQETLRTYWKIGHLIYEHLLQEKDRAEYGEQLIPRLSLDLKMGQRRLYEMLQFYRSFPIMRTFAQLGWSHYRLLMKLPTEQKRSLYLKQATRSGWTVRELETQIQADARLDPQPQSPPPAGPLPALRGQLYTYRLINSPTGNGLRLDLGFGTHLNHPLTGLTSPQAGTFVQTVPTPSNTYAVKLTEGRSAAYHSYTAVVVEIIDGDTLWVDIDCGFHIYTLQKVRLRGIDTPELKTAEGQRARDFVNAALENLPFIAVTTTRPDKYDRYLTDIFYHSGTEDPEVVLREGTFLNRAILKTGLAERFKK